MVGVESRNIRESSPFRCSLPSDSVRGCQPMEYLRRRQPPGVLWLQPALVHRIPSSAASSPLTVVKQRDPCRAGDCVNCRRCASAHAYTYTRARARLLSTLACTQSHTVKRQTRILTEPAVFSLALLLPWCGFSLEYHHPFETAQAAATAARGQPSLTVVAPTPVASALPPSPTPLSFAASQPFRLRGA